VEAIELKDLRPTRECMACTDSRALRHFPTRAPTFECEHDVNTCKRCLRTWITMQFETKMWNEIGCPECSARIQYEDMRDFAPEAVFRR
jgi:DNA-directed RNA polymerase subunit RPC12/RpoP